MKKFFGIGLLAMAVVPLHVTGQQAAAPQSLEQRVELLERRVRTLSELVLRLDRARRINWLHDGAAGQRILSRRYYTNFFFGFDY